MGFIIIIYKNIIKMLSKSLSKFFFSKNAAVWLNKDTKVIC